MASDNEKKLTRYTSSATVITADSMNRIYGGEFGFRDDVDEFDPLVFGHVHDGTHEDGHASKILLTNGAHIRGFLSNANLGGTNGSNPAVRYTNIVCYSESVYGTPAARRAAAAAGGYDLEVLAIPEYTEDPLTGDRCYYLDLSNSAGGVDGSVQFNEAGSFGGNDDLFYDYSNLRLGVGTNSPQRKIHIADGSSPPVRIEGISPGTGVVLVVDGSGDVYGDPSIVSQDSFKRINLINVSGGSATGGPVVADSPNDQLYLDAGTNIVLTGDAGNDRITISANVPDQDLYNTVGLTATSGTQTGDATLSADSPTEMLTLAAGPNITLDGDAASDTVTISAEDAPRKFFSQWIDADQAVIPKDSGSRGNTLLGDRIIAYKYKVGLGDLGISDFFINVSMPLDGQLGQAQTGSLTTDGSFQGGLTGYPVGNNISDTANDAPTSCRVTAYFVLDRTNDTLPGLPSGETPSSLEGGADLTVSVAYGNLTGIVPPPQTRIVPVADAEFLQNHNGLGVVRDWGTNDSSDSFALQNTHSYSGGINPGPPPSPFGTVQDGMMVVSDFSPLKLQTQLPTDGLANFRITLSDISGSFYLTETPEPADPYAEMDDEDKAACTRLVGVRLLWIWE
jgi:hypothetical protein